MNGLTIPRPGTQGEESAEILYESTSTRVYRRGDTRGSVVCKEPLGADAARRLRHEAGILVQLAGIAGMAQLAAGRYPGAVLALQDRGGTTAAQLLRAGPLEVGALLALAVRLVQSVAAMHRAGVIHRDINPANIVMSQDGEPVLIDFDLAVQADHHAAGAQDGRIVGTLGYLAPEQSGRTGRAVDQRADLYALGATLYEMAVGKLPFEAQDTLQLIHDHLVHDPVAPALIDARVPLGLSNIILRLLAKAPEQRFQSAEGLLHDLRRLQGAVERGERGDAGSFALGERDFPARLAPPDKLIGRDAESAMLRAALALARVSGSERQTVLVEGAAGVGKSALINVLRPEVAAAGGWFIHGKVDQFQRDGSATGAMTQALRALGRLLLALPRDELAAQRQRTLEALGRNAGLMTRLLPEFALLLGEQAEVPESDPRQAGQQLQHAAVDLLRSVASAERPLVIVLDDLQWAPELSLRGFESLMRAPDLRGVLLVGLYRRKDADADHALSRLLTQWREQSPPPLEIDLHNLAPADMGAMTAQMLRLAPGPAGELTRCVAELTGGNPFDTVEMINALRRDNVLHLGEAGWQWDAAAIRRFVGKSNVVDLLTARIARLPDVSRALLEFMSCLGNSVDRKLLRAAAGLTDDELRQGLSAPLEDGLLIADPGPGQDSVQFRHDRVQQAVLRAMDDAGRSERQLAMARRLAREPAFEGDAALQYLACAGAVIEHDEQLRVAQLLQRAAGQLAITATYVLAERYLAAAAALLVARGDPADAADTALGGEIDARRHAALYNLGRLDEADGVYAAMKVRTLDPLDIVEPTCLQIRSLEMRARTQDCAELGSRLLAQLGLDIPDGYDDPTLEHRVGLLGEWVRAESGLDHARRRQITDPRLLAIAKLLSRMVRTAYLCGDARALEWLLLECQRLWAEHGPCPELVVSLGRMSVTLIRNRQDYRTGFDVGKLVVTVGDALGFEPQTSEARVLFAIFSSYWFEPLETSYDHAVRAYQGVHAGGEISYSCYVFRATIVFLLEIAPTIEHCAAEIETGIALCRRAGNAHAAALYMCDRQLLRALAGKTKGADSLDDEQFNEQEFVAQMAPTVELSFRTRRAQLAMLLGDVSALRDHARHAISLLGAEPLNWDTLLPIAMASAWQAQEQRRVDPSADTSVLLAELESSRSWLAERAADQPANFLHLLRFVEAEQAWALGDLWKAAGAFDAAVLEASSRQRPWHRALIAERAGLFHLAQGMERAGRVLLVEARDHYAAWGAAAKVTRMQREHLFLQAAGHLHAGVDAATSLRGSSTSVSPDALDLVGVLRASQALSSETSLERLALRVNEVLAALSGATKVLVLSWNEDQWWLLAPAPGETAVPVSRAAERGLLPLSAFSYAERTQEPLLVDDAIADDRFARDPYFHHVPLCSLLVAPISSQGAARAMLILENRQGRAAFSAQRLDAVMLMAGQLAVSLANAQLYQSLERRVQARTRELEQTQAELVATARRAGMAEIANNVLHNVGNVLNSINVSANVVSRTIGNSRIVGLTRAVDLLNEHQHDLPGFIAGDARGKVLLPYLNQLVGALQAEQQEALGDLERLSRSVDHITYVVATQQSHAGPSSVLELAQPQELLEEALRLSAAAFSQGSAAIVRRYEPVPAMALDRQRLLQILVNLIRNAAQAMDNVPHGSRLLELGLGVVQGEDGGRLRITVTDEGEGIAPENLPRIFAHGFTTRKDGHGFGLHSSALAAVEMGGKLTVHSEGLGRGAVFTFELPTRIVGARA